MNPFDRVDRPRNNRFVGDTYSEEEMHKLIECVRTDTIHHDVMLAGMMELRRIEELGVRWSRIDFENNSVLLDTKIVEYDKDGKSEVAAAEHLSCRTQSLRCLNPSRKGKK